MIEDDYEEEFTAREDRDLELSVDLIKQSYSSDDEQTRKKRFLFRLLSELHGSGNLSYRTEAYVCNVGKSLGVIMTCTVFPVTALVSFYETKQLLPHSSDSYTLNINNGLNCNKLSMLDQLCFEMCRSRLDFNAADLALESIEQSRLHPWWANALAFMVSAFASTTMFFGGTIVDGAWSALFGCLVYIVGVICGNVPGLAEIECFVTSLTVAVLSTALDRYIYSDSLCLYGQIFGAIVWHLPG